jgi:hypothetical protein
MALQHALRYQAFDSKAIERILLAKANPRTLESVRNEQARKELEKTLPRIEQRPLDEYCSLLSNNEEKEDGKGSEHTATGSGPSQNLPQNIEAYQDGKSP